MRTAGQLVADYSSEEMMIIEMSRRIPDEAVCFVGVGRPTLAAGLARATHAAGVVLVFESGAIGAKPTRPPHSIADGELVETADMVVPTPEIFAYWLGGGKIDVGILGAAQVDQYGNLNSTVVGSYEHPKVRLPGAGGAPEIATAARTTFVLAPHERRVFVEQLDFRTSVGDGDGRHDRERLGLPGTGVRVVVTDLGVLAMDPDSDSGRLTLNRIHSGVTVEDVRDATSWDLEVSPDLRPTTPPTAVELAALREFADAIPPADHATALDLSTRRRADTSRPGHDSVL